jgi:hypothetical protein
MKRCPQTKNQSVLQHGFSVKNYLFDLLDHLSSNTPLQYEWRLPEWIAENRDFILSELPDRAVLKLATIMHDCGKPLCITTDENGNNHFPDHARVSYDVFNKFYDSPIAADLILHDMDVHLLKADGVEEFSKNPNAITHLIIGLAELHSNAAMFGGIESTSFKIKWKALNQRGKQILNIKKQTTT